MALFIWHNKYSVNNEELDKDHKALFDVFNKLHDSCIHKDNSFTLSQIIDVLISYTNHHFATEEQYMRAIGYDNIDKHIAEHKIFKDRISQLQHRNNRDDIVVTKELIVYLGNWLLNHVIVEDKKYSK
ncbi:MAG TPA: bacteriohemerythrin [Anaerolineales bacterium]|nr:bacteriohemerythrin [Anaerolineales bacterium]